MELTDYLYVLRRFWMSIAAVTLVTIAAVAAYTLFQTPTYTSSTSLFFAVRSADTIGEAAQGSSYTERQVNSFAEVAETPVVLQPVIDELGLETSPASLSTRVTVSVPSSTSILRISVSDTDPELAANIAREVAENLVIVVEDISPRDAFDRPVVEATVITPAVVPTAWTSPNVTRNLALGAMLGLMLGLGQALLRHVLDRKIRNTADVARVTDIPVIGGVAEDPEAGKRPLAILQDPHSPRAEDYRRIRTAMRFLGVDGRSRVFAVSSSVAEEGKSTTALNLALALSAADQKVLLIDADLRRPTIASRLNLENAAGLTTVLIGRAYFNEVVQPIRSGPHVLTSGKTPPNPSELLGSDAMRDLLTQASDTYDYVLLDTAPLVSVSDTAVLSSLVDGVLLVTASGEVDSDELDAAIGAVEAGNGRVAGIVLNKVSAKDVGYRSHYYVRQGGYPQPQVEPQGEVPAEPVLVESAEPPTRNLEAEFRSRLARR